MSEIIAGIYDIEREIGSGGGSVVYLAKHLRLNKQVVLKGDKRSLSAHEDALRREVDSLKNISHTYIPQVYDYVVENDVVYTVMDYVEGESLDKILARGECFKQARIISVAQQLLEAVAHLHEQPPHGILHADIKPANIMLTPRGDIRLIDFNIALLLGEDGAISVGRSFGYASPEHYGIDYSSGATTRNVTLEDASTKFTEAITVLKETGIEAVSQVLSSSTSGKKKLLDVRSDVYSVGATLYHLITGERPKRDATDVVTVLRKHCNTALAAVVAKAMAPNPDMRYQSANDMLRAILNLRNDDPRVRRWKRIRSVACTVLTLAFIAGGLTAFAGWRLAEQALLDEAEREAELQRIVAEEQRVEAEMQRIEAEAQRIEAEVQRAEARLQERHVLALNSAEALRLGDRYGALALAVEALPCDISPLNLPEVRKALTDALGIYDLSDGFKPHRTVALPAETLTLAIAPNGETFAAMSFGTLSVFYTKSGELITELAAIESGLAEVVYVNDDIKVFAGENGVTAFDLSARLTTWTGAHATTFAVSANGKMIAAVNRDALTAAIYGIDGQVFGTVDFGGQYMHVTENDRFGNPGGRIFEMNYDGSLLAVSFSGGGLEIFDVAGGQRGIIIFDYSEYTFFEGGFHDKYFAFSATDAEESLFTVIDTDAVEMTIATTLSGRIGVYADESGVFMSYNRIHVQIDPLTARQIPVEHDPRDHIAGDWRVDGNLNTPIVRIYQYVSHADKALFAYDPEFTHNQARINYAGDRVMLFSYRGFRVYDIGGELLKETTMRNPAHIHDQQFRRYPDLSYLEVIYNDGTIRKYSAENGEFIGEELGLAPDLTLFEVFYTDTMRIESTLHGAPRAYNLRTGELIRELEQDAFLTYVTQVGEYVITEYITADGHRFGILVDGQTAETLAYIPNLSDIIDERLIINDRRTGTLRETRLHSETELIDMARILLG